MGTISTQVVIERLIITNIDKNFIKDADNTIQVQGNRNPALYCNTAAILLF